MKGFYKVCLLTLGANLLLGCGPDRPASEVDVNKGSHTNAPAGGNSSRSSGAAKSDIVDKDSALEDDEGSRATDDDNDLTYHGRQCTIDCSGHRAGYEWAERKGITDSDDCG